MKRFICLIISLCLVFGSFSFSFAAAADWTTTDQSNLSNASSKLTNIYNTLSSGGSIYNTLNTISSTLTDIKNYLFDDGHDVAYWAHSIYSWMSPIYTAVTAVPSDLSVIQGLLGYPTTTQGGGTTWNPYLKDIIDGTVGAPSYIFSMNNNSNGYIDTFSLSASTNPIKDLSNYAYWFLWTQMTINNKMIDFGSYITANYNANQNAVNWGSLSTSTFTPSSFADGTYKWLSAIQAPVARLSYVLASDERISAQQAAALAEQQVVDDFINPTGDSSATASDFGSISDLSSGYQQNFGSTASVTGIFNIFDSNNFGWFSSETYQQLDTTVATRGSSFETPLLDQQLEDISRALGVDYAN